MNLDASPEWLVDSAAPPVLLAAARRAKRWDDAVAATLDHVLCQWTRNACARHDDRDGLLDLHDTVGRFIDIARERRVPLAARWQVLLDLLEAHRIVLAARDPERVRRRAHVDRILAKLAGGGEVEQKALRAALDLSESRLAQLLSLMETHGLVARRKQGRVSYVKGVEASASVPPAVAMERFGSVFRQAA